MTGNELGHLGIKVMAEVKHPMQIEDLNLSGEHMPSRLLKKLIKSKGNDLSIAGVRTLASLFDKCPKMRVLDLSGMSRLLG